MTSPPSSGLVRSTQSRQYGGLNRTHSPPASFSRAVEALRTVQEKTDVTCMVCISSRPATHQLQSQ